jgi:hypothetical protein
MEVSTAKRDLNPFKEYPREEPPQPQNSEMNSTFTFLLNHQKLSNTPCNEKQNLGKLN